MPALVKMALTTATAVLLALMLPAALRAQSEERSRCLARGGVSPEQKLNSCTAVIESGQETPQGLVAAFNNRGNANLSSQSHDRAIADYTEAIRLDPKY